MPASKRGYTSGRFALEIGGANAGFLQQHEGGNPSSAVVKEAVNPSYFVGKHLAGLYYEPLMLQFGLALDKVVYDWISASWQGKYARKDGKITTYDVTNKPLGEQDFFHARISETTIPALDTSSKDPAYLTLQLDSEFVRVKFGQGAASSPGKPEKLWKVSDFALNIDGLECSCVGKIDTFTIKQNVNIHDVGESRDYNKGELLPIDFPDLQVTLPLADFQTWYDWSKTFLEMGRNNASDEKTGSLVFLAPDHKIELARINFFGLGIYKLVPAVNQDQQVVASLYCERMEFVYPTPAP